MAISLIGTPTTGTGNNPANGTFTLPSGYQAGDLIVTYLFARASAFTFSISNHTEKRQDAGTSGRIFVGYQWSTSGSMTDPTFTRTASSSNCTVCWGCLILRGVSDSGSGASGDPFDADPASASAYSGVQNPDPVAIVPTRAYDWVLTVVGRTDDFGSSVSAPSTYTTSTDLWTESTAGTDGGIAVAYKEVTSTASEDPGAWTLGSGGGTNNGYTWTGSLRRAYLPTSYGIVALAGSGTSSYTPAGTDGATYALAGIGLIGRN